MPPSKQRPRFHVTIDEVARRAGVSISTVSRVLSQTAPVSEETTARVREAVDALGYVPQTAARNLAKGKTNTFGLLLPAIGAHFFTPLLQGIEAVAEAADYDLLIATERSASTNRPPRRPLGTHNTDGLLIFTDNVDESELRRFHALGFPAVLLYRSSPAGLAFPSITIENRQGARQIVDHLIVAHGLRRIALLRGPRGNEDSFSREQGYREALAAHGIPFDPALVADGHFEEQSARAAVEGWLSSGVAFDAIFASDDDSAGGALIALQAAGLRVPQDVALVGFDDSPLAHHLSPPLTTVHAPTQAVGRAAAQQLIQLIQHGAAEPTVVLPTSLAIRQSCGCM